MQRVHRRAHVVLWIVVGPASLAALAWAVWSRPAVPIEPQTAEDLGNPGAPVIRTEDKSEAASKAGEGDGP